MDYGTSMLRSDLMDMGKGSLVFWEHLASSLMALGQKMKAAWCANRVRGLRDIRWTWR